MIRKINTILIAAIILSVLYFFLSGGKHFIVWAYFLAVCGLYLSKWFKHIVLITSVAGIFIALRFFYVTPAETALAVVLFIFIIPVPYYHSYEAKKTAKELREKNKFAKDKYAQIISEHALSFDERKKREEDIEKIMQLYIIGRELSKKMFFEDYADTIIRALSNRNGVISVTVFDRTNGFWKTIASSKTFHQNGWQEYVAADNSLEAMNLCATVKNPVFIGDEESTVFWPLKIEDELLGAVAVVCGKKFAGDYVKEGAIFAPQIALNAKRVKLFVEVNEKSRNDGLTGLLRRSYFLDRLGYEIRREKRYSGGFYILMLDIDFFKSVNDKYGHLEGDKVLHSVGGILSDYARREDLVARYGGEEFIIFMPQVKRYEAISAAENIRKAVEKQKYYVKDSEFSVTISVGISGYPDDDSSLEKIIKDADDALYKAKQNGRNQVAVYGDNPA
ncbi:GGDEF domain-containing protein [Endomicrobium proavitum]|uniref:diguanylate cyclase n=1 Tax=Endomicrobium proavitum TaxID=1408281 RepID=A0A0G3WFY7_9BACT|nr:GGDEF domain-containing protein [Endomicrobium proavitum]AKL97531.1 putative Diguanylate cyclase [Endomicrobium proavitum]